MRMGTKILTYAAIALGIIAFSGLFVLIFGNSLTVHCVRPAGQNPVCKISKALLGRYPTSSRTVSDVVDVQQDRSCDDDCSYRMLLVTGNGESVPLNEVFTDLGPVQKQMAEFSAFLDGTAPSFDYEEGVLWWVVALTGGGGLIGLLVLAANFVSDLLKKS